MITTIYKCRFHFLPVAALLLWSCTTENVSVECSQPEFVNSFPKEVRLDPVEPFMTDLAGMVNFVANDSLLVGLFQQDPYLKVYSLESGEPLGSFITKGQGPGEFTGMPTNLSVCETSEGPKLRFMEQWKKRYHTMDLTSSICSQKEVYDTIVESKNFKDIKYLIPMPSADTIAWYYNMADGGVMRIINSQSGQASIPNLGNLEADWSEFDDNIISFIPAFSIGADVVAEAMTHLNQINMYSLSDSTFRKTICVGEKIDNVAAEDSKSRDNRKRAYQGAQAIGNYFVFLYNGATESDFVKGDADTELQIFSTEGEPVVRIALPIPANSFFIDRSGKLFLFSYLGESESVYRYEIPEIQSIINVN